VTTAFILTRAEWNFARTGEGWAASLVDKGLAVFDEDGGITLGQELRLIAEEAVSADAEEREPGVFALRGGRFCMLIEPYRLIPDALKISLYKDEKSLVEAIKGRDERIDGETAG
jgi:hypothetical protein